MKAGSSLDSRLMVPDTKKSKECSFQTVKTEFSNIHKAQTEVALGRRHVTQGKCPDTICRTKDVLSYKYSLNTG